MVQQLKVTNDKVFQRIFGKIGNENITKGFLEKVLGIEIEELTLDTNKRLIGETLDEKIGRIDVKAILSNGSKVIIEMQVAAYDNMAERLLYYWARTYTADLKKGTGYEELNKTIAILISAENLEKTEGIERYHTKWNLREVEEVNRVYTDDLEIHIIELSKFKEGKDNPEDNWIKFIQGGKTKMDRIEKMEKEIQEAIKELELLENNPEMRAEYEQREIEIRDRATILAQAKRSKEKLNAAQEKLDTTKEELNIAQEKLMLEQEQKKQMIKFMYQKGIQIEEIASITKMEIEEIKNILELKNK